MLSSSPLAEPETSSRLCAPSSCYHPFSPSFSGLSLGHSSAVSPAPASTLPPKAISHDKTLLAGDEHKHVGSYRAQEFQGTLAGFAPSLTPTPLPRRALCDRAPLCSLQGGHRGRQAGRLAPPRAEKVICIPEVPQAGRCPLT